MAVSDCYDVVILGAGPGGYVAGIRAAQLGMKVCVVEKDAPGGVCLNWGCIPSKNLIHQATLYGQIGALEAMGIMVDKSDFNYTNVHASSRGVTRKLSGGVEFLLKKNKVRLVKGTARITPDKKVALEDGTVLAADNILVATGSRPLELPGFEFDEESVLSSSGILSMTSLPQSLLILGGGAIGCEFAYIMNTFGVKVVLVEMADHILPFEDGETAAILCQSFKNSGIDVRTGTRAVSLAKSAGKLTASLEDKQGNPVSIDAEKALCVFGRTPNTDGIGLEALGLKTEQGYVPVGDHYQTDLPGVYAIGDVVRTPLLAHVASREGEIAVEHMAGRATESRLDVDAIPSAIYCEPQVASFGLREAQANQKNIPCKKAVFPFQGVGKAVATGNSEGMVKVLYHRDTHEILGAHIVGHDATELIHELLLAKTGELLPGDVAGMIHAHPTLSESLMESMRAVDGLPIHV